MIITQSLSVKLGVEWRRVARHDCAHALSVSRKYVSKLAKRSFTAGRKATRRGRRVALTCDKSEPAVAIGSVSSTDGMGNLRPAINQIA